MTQLAKFTSLFFWQWPYIFSSGYISVIYFVISFRLKDNLNSATTYPTLHTVNELKAVMGSIDY